MNTYLEGTRIVPEFNDRGVDCYRLDGGSLLNRYYVISEAGSRRLLNTPEVVGFEVYNCLLRGSARMLGYFRDQGDITSANILSILRGALNYPMEQSCYLENIPVHDISFLSSERVFHNDEIAGLKIKYSKLATVPDSTLLIGDIIATGETLVHCLSYVTDHYRLQGARLRNIIVFTIGGSTGIKILEQLTRQFKRFWPEFEGFIAVYYEGIFNTYEDRGVCTVQLPDVDFYWGGGIVAPEYRRQTLMNLSTLFEKCVIYDGGARRYEISDHVREVVEYWEQIRDRADLIDPLALAEERLGYPSSVSFSQWRRANHYEALDEGLCEKLYALEQDFLQRVASVSLRDMATRRIDEITSALKLYVL